MSPRHRAPHPEGRPEAAPPGLGDPPTEAAVVLEEVGAPHGFVLWRLLQDVSLWSRMPAGQRGQTFRGPAEGPPPAAWVPGLEVPIAEIRAQLRPGQEGDPGSVARACMEASDWAAENRFPGTALVFAHAAASCAPSDAAYAHRVAMLARQQAAHVRAEVWYRRAIVLGRRGQDWYSYARSLDGLGLLHWQRGNIPAARVFHLRALKAARNHRVRKVEAQALHNLCVIASERGAVEEAVSYGREAFRLYGRDHPDLPALASDLAWTWMEHEGAYDRALPIFQSLHRHFRDPVQRLLNVANIARAAGGAGDDGTFAWAWEALWEMLWLTPDEQGHAAALLDAAHGARILGRLPQAQVAAARALALAERRGETKVCFAAEALLGSLRQGAPEPDVREATPCPRDAEADDHLASQLVAALTIPRW